MAPAFESFLVLFVVFATCSARSIYAPVFDTSEYSGSKLPDYSTMVFDYNYSPQVNAGRPMMADVASVANGAPGNEFMPIFSSSPRVLQAMATADAISEIASAKTARAKAEAEARKISLHISATKEAIRKIQVEADERSRSVTLHAPRANLAAERKRQAMEEEKAELLTAKRDEAYVNRLKRAVINAFAMVKEGELRSRKLIAQLEREANYHDSQAKYFLMRADTVAASAGLNSISIPAGLVPDPNAYDMENDYLNSFAF